MDTILHDISAFYLYRIPPIVMDMVLDSPDLSTRSGRLRLNREAAYLGYIPLPLHELVFSRNDLNRSRSIKQHLWSNHNLLPSEHRVDSYLSASSPLFTLLSLAASLPIEQLCMAAYEMCGSFSVIELTPEHRARLQEQLDSGMSLRRDGWEPCVSADGKLTNLWRRPPLVDLDELRRFVEEARGMRGHKRLEQAAKAVCGVAASPLEAQAALLLCGPRAIGGDALGPVALNRTIRLNPAARDIARRDRCVADLFFEPHGSGRPLIVECLGRAYHAGEERGLSDSERTEALQCMGFTVIPVTSRELSDARTYRHILAHIASELGVTLRQKGERQQDQEDRLRRNIFSDWWMLGR